MTNDGARTYTVKAITDLWTGDADGKPGRTITTGLLGAIRWWFEVLVRGLGGKACDPTMDGNRCPDSRNKPTEPGHHCVACELFGCTGWARKFRFEVLNANGEVKIEQIEKDQTFKLRFTPLRLIRDEEWALLDLTLRLIAEYGAIGGKTVYKPSDGPGLADLDMSDFQRNNGQVTVLRSRKGLPLEKGDLLLKIRDTSISSLADAHAACSGKLHGEQVQLEIKRGASTRRIQAWFGKRHHIDYGLIQVVRPPEDALCCDRQELDNYVRQECWRTLDHGYFAWASLENFWCVKGRYLARQGQKESTFNTVVGRKPDKSVKEKKGKGLVRWSDLLEHPEDEPARWLAGRQQESKKVFSFKEPESARRTFGFVNPGTVEFDAIKARLKTAWPDLKETEFLRGDEILKRLLSWAGATT